MQQVRHVHKTQQRLQHTTQKRLAGRNSTPFPTPEYQTFKVTWYSPLGGVGDGLTTKSGRPVVQGETIAVDPSVIPLGTRVLIKFNDGTEHIFTAEDTGGAIRGNHIDIFMWSNDACIQNGVEDLDVLILPKE